MSKLKKDRNAIIHSIKTAWKCLDRSIYVGERLEANMLALTFASVLTVVLGFYLLIMNILTGQTDMIFASVATFFAGAGCAYCVLVLKDRNKAIIIPTVFCAVVFTVYTLTGAGQGSAVLWTLLLPIGMCYFVNVKYGILLSAYYVVLFIIAFYSPLRTTLGTYYNEGFMERFPVLFASLSLFTGMAMVQYHRFALFEIDHSEKLTEEVAKQTAIAEERARRIEQMSFQTIQTLANAIDAKDPYTIGHSTRVSQYSVLIAQELGWDEDRIDDLKFAALLHDIGKIGVPDSILNCPRKLTEVEYGIIKSHTTMGANILKNRTTVRMAEDVARSHHERYDGKGYPLGLQGNDISEEARIAAIADAFDAMSSNRVYRRACDYEYIRRELSEGRGKQFDPHFVDIFLNIWDRGLLDGILKNDETETNKGFEESSALLQKIMETFVSQNASDDLDITTGIMGRTVGETAIAQAMKENAGCLVFFDVDNLKRINDTNGHDAGDKALKLMGDILSEYSKDNALCCRLGGDEFLLFMKEVSRDDAQDRVRRIISAYASEKEKDARISAASLSAGMVMCRTNDPYADVFNKADKALYHIKQNGKNNCGFYEESDVTVNERVDMDRLVAGIRNSGYYTGAMGVEYREFTKLYDYVDNLKKRFSYSFNLIVISLHEIPGNNTGVEEFEKAMACMEQSIRQTLRGVDIMTRYSGRHILVMLVGTNEEGVKTAVDRIFRGYYKMNGSGSYSPSYMMAER